MVTKKIKMRQLGEEKAEEVVELTFSVDDWEVLQEFRRYAEELAQSSLVQQGVPFSVNVKWTAEQGLEVKADLPPDEQIDALLMRLRPFILNDERTSFNRMRNAVARSSSSSNLHAHLDSLKFRFSGEALQSLMVAGTYSSDETEPRIVNSEDMLQLWLNGYRFHRDKEKRQIVDAAHAIMPLESSVALFLALIKDKVAAITALARLVAVIAGELETADAEVLLPPPTHYRSFVHATISGVNWFELEPGRRRSLPEEGSACAKRVFDLTSLGAATMSQFLDLFGRLWMSGQIPQGVGEHHYFFRVGKGSRFGPGAPTEHGYDVIVSLKVVALLYEDELSESRRKPARALLKRMRAERGDAASQGVFLKRVDTEEELERIRSSEPGTQMDLVVVPRVAFRHAYWPMSDQAKERIRKICEEGRELTFEEVEGSQVLRAWEIFTPSGPEVETEGRTA